MNHEERDMALKKTAALRTLVDEQDPTCTSHRFNDLRADIQAIEETFEETTRLTTQVEEEMVSQDDYDRCESEKGDLESNISKLEDRIYELKEDCEAANFNLDNLQVYYDDLMSLCNGYKNSIDHNAERHNTQVAELQEEIEQLKNEIVELENDLAGKE